MASTGSGRSIDGEIGLEALGRIVRHPALAQCPIFLEVPGYANDGPDRPNMERLYALAGRDFPVGDDG